MPVSKVKSAGRVGVQAVPLVGGFDSELRRKLKAIEKILKVKVDAVLDTDRLKASLEAFEKNYQLKIGAVLDSKGFEKGLDDQLKKSRQKSSAAPIQLGTLDDQFFARIQKELNERRLVLEPHAKTDDAREKLNRLRTEFEDKLKIHMKTGVTTEESRRELESLLKEFNGRSIGVSVNADVLAASARLREFMARPRHLRLFVDADTKRAAAQLGALMATYSGMGAANRSLEQMGQLLARLDTHIPKVGGLITVIGGIGSAAVAAVSGVASLLKSMESLLGVAGLLPAAVAGVAVMGGTLFAAFKGIGSAVSKLSDNQDGGGSSVRNAQIQAIQVAQAQRRISDAHENAADAIVRADERIAESQKAVRDAVADQEQDRTRSLKAIAAAQAEVDAANANATKLEGRLTEARDKARQSIKELNREYNNSIISRKEAEIEYTRAVQALESAQGDNSRSDREREILALAVEKASAQKDQAIEKEKDLGAESKKATKLGVEGNEEWLSAQEAVTNAKDRSLRATEALNEANTDFETNRLKYAERVRGAMADEQLAQKAAEKSARDSQRAILEATEAAQVLALQRTDTASQAEDAMAQLSTEGKRAARSFLHVRDILSSVQRKIQDNFFRGFTTPMVDMVESLLPQLESGMGKVATQMGNGWGTFFNSVRKSLSGGQLERILSNIATAIERGNKAIDPLVRAFTVLTAVGSDFLPQLAEGFAKWADQFATFVTDAAADGSLKAWIQGGIDGVKELAHVFKGAYRIFSEVAHAATLADGLTMKSLGENLNKAADVMGREPFKSSMVHVFKGARLALDGIGIGVNALGRVFSNNGPQIEKIMGLMGSGLGKIIELVANVIGDPKFISGVDKFLTGFGKGLDVLIQNAPVFAEIFGSIFEIAGGLWELIAPVLSEMAKTLLPMIKSLKDILLPIFDALKPFAPLIAQIVLAFVALKGVSVGFKIFDDLARPITKLIELFAGKGGKGGGGLMGVVKSLFSKGVPGADKFGGIFSKVGGFVSKLFPIFSKVGGAISKVGPILMRVAGFGLRFIPVIGWIITAITGVIAIIENWDAISKWFGEAGTNISNGWNNLSNGVKETTVNVAIWAAEQTANLKKKWDDTWTSIGSKTQEISEKVKGYFGGLWESFVTKATGIRDRFIGTVLGIRDGIVNNLRDGVNQAVGYFTGLPQRIMETFTSFRDRLFNSGKALVGGFIEGFKSRFEEARKTVGDWLQSLRDFFPFSPARTGPFSGTGYTTYSGAALAGGFAQGIQSGAGGVRKAIEGLMGGTKIGLDGSLRNLESFATSVLDRLGFNGRELVDSGKALMRGLGEGIKSVAPGLYKTVESVMGQMRKYFPFSPAKLGPFSGKGYTTYSGRALASDFASGIRTSTGEVTKASLGLVKAVDIPRTPKFDYGSVAEIKASAGGASLGNTQYVTNNVHEAVSAEATAMAITRRQKAKMA